MIMKSMDIQKKEYQNLVYVDFDVTKKGNLNYTIYPIIYHDTDAYVLLIPVYKDTMYTWQWKRYRYQYINNFKKFVKMNINKRNKSTIKRTRRSTVHIKYDVFGMFIGTFDYNPEEDSMEFVIKNGNESTSYFLRKKNNNTFVDIFGKEYKVVKL